jgi:beta-glucosidase
MHLTSTSISSSALQLGGAEVIDSDKVIAEAVELAKDADAVIAVVGLNADWETEGYDRTTLALPGRTNELVSKVAAANPKTIVVTQSVSNLHQYTYTTILTTLSFYQGSSVTLPWVDSIPGLVHAWYLGNASGDAIADVLFGKHNPSGKLSLTFPKAEEDVPAYGHFHSENGEVRYAEDLFVVCRSRRNLYFPLSDVASRNRVINITNTARSPRFSPLGNFLFRSSSQR